jgi:hypothetical protein
MSGSNNIKKRKSIVIGEFIVVAALLFAPVTISALFAQEQTQAQAVFKSPEEAMKALVDAVQSDNNQKMLTILGPEGKNAISSGDEVADKNHHAKFVNSYQEKVSFVKDKDRVSVILGKDNWPMAIPLVKKDDVWVFDTHAGLQELLKRRIGRNELSAINFCKNYVLAQIEYAKVDRTMEGVMQYAQKFCSTPGERDGLYWEVAAGEQPSPLGPSYAVAAGEGYKSKDTCSSSPAPYHGYNYKILTAQSAVAPGGAYNYVINGHMVGGFALAAWPAEYGTSGIMTFIVNQNGIVYEKDFGPDTAKIIKSITVYNPDQTWRRAQ